MAGLGFHSEPVPSTPQLWELFGKEEEWGRAKNPSLMMLCDTACDSGDSSALWGCSETSLTLLGTDTSAS